MNFPKDKEWLPILAYVDEIVRENARLTVQHEVDVLRADQLAAELEEARASTPAVQEALAEAAKQRESAHIFKVKMEKSEAMLRKALADLHFVMAGGDPCSVCTVKCAFGEGNCKPVWRGETEEAEE